jgi:uncharacterized protein YdhG (YjbR/CyaY superfamily)
MSELGIYRVDAAWVPAGHEGVEPHPVSFLVFQGIGEKERAAVVLRADLQFLKALLDKLPLSRIWEYASANAARREIQKALDGFKQDLKALMRSMQASKVHIYPDETGSRGKARGGAITGFFMRRKGAVRHQAGGTRVHVMTFGVQSPTGASASLDLSQLLRGATQALQTRREKGKDINELALISPGLYDGLLSLRQAQVEAEERAREAYREIAARIEAMSRDIQEALALIRGGRLVESQGLSPEIVSPEIVEGIAFSLENPGGVPSSNDPIAAIFVWDVAEKFVAAEETGEYLVLRWPRKEGEGDQAQEEQE